ncbi:hypothetical protein L195_g027622, partial [Trifolium pratense]
MCELCLLTVGLVRDSSADRRVRGGADRLHEDINATVELGEASSLFHALIWVRELQLEEVDDFHKGRNDITEHVAVIDDEFPSRVLLLYKEEYETRKRLKVMMTYLMTEPASSVESCTGNNEEESSSLPPDIAIKCCETSKDHDFSIGASSSSSSSTEVSLENENVNQYSRDMFAGTQILYISMAFLRSRIHDVITKLSTETSVEVDLESTETSVEVDLESIDVAGAHNMDSSTSQVTLHVIGIR